MQGFPKTIGTAADVKNLLADDAYKSQALATVQTMLDERYGWILAGKLATTDAGDTSAGHKVVEVTSKNEAGENVTERYQYTWGIQEGTALARLGITVAEAVEWGCVDRVIEPPAVG